MDNLNTENKMTVSVVIPAYNNQQYLCRSIDSVLAQTRPADEIIVVDDGSTDDTASVIQSYGDKVRYLQQENAGASAARNTGIEAATGNWIAFLDADDEWLPEKLQCQLTLLQQHPSLVWITANYEECLCEEKRRAPHTPPAQCLSFTGGRDYYESYFQAICQYQWGHTNCMMIQNRVLQEVGLFCTDLKKANDIDMWLRVAYRYPQIGYCHQPLAVYHLSVSGSIVKKYRLLSVYADFMQRHFDIAVREGAVDAFLPAAAAIMRRWIRGMLFEGRKAEIRQMIRQFPQAFSPAYRGWIYTLTIFPRVTAITLHGLSRLIRLLRLRRRVTRRPAKPAQ